MQEPGVGALAPQCLADQLTLFQPREADSAHPLLLAPPIFFSPSGIPVLAQLNTYVLFSVYIYCHSQCICPQGNIDKFSSLLGPFGGCSRLLKE